MRIKQNSLIKPRKSMLFTPKSTILPSPQYMGSYPPVCPDPKIYEKMMVKHLVFGPPKPPKMVLFRSFWTPPKIIKNRLNFAHSEKFIKSTKNGVFITPTTKIIYFAWKAANYTPISDFSRNTIILLKLYKLAKIT